MIISEVLIMKKLYIPVVASLSLLVVPQHVFAQEPEEDGPMAAPPISQQEKGMVKPGMRMEQPRARVARPEGMRQPAVQPPMGAEMRSESDKPPKPKPKDHMVVGKPKPKPTGLPTMKSPPDEPKPPPK